MTSQGRVRAIAYGAMALFVFGTVVITNPLPRASAMPALATRAQSQARQDPTTRERFDTLGPRETLVSVLGRAGINARDARDALSTKLLEPGKIRVGMPVHTRSGVADSVPTEIILGLAIDKFLHLRRSTSGWTGEVEVLPWTTDTIMVSGAVKTNLYAAVHAAARSVLPDTARERLGDALAALYEFRIDMSRDLRVGDPFTVVAERLHGPHASVRLGRVLAATMRFSGTTIDAIAFKSASVSGEWFDSEGRPLRSGFLRAPLELRRITSNFGMRKHPILGTMRKHEGTDYGATAGTPVRAIGDGVVIRAGWGSGYGNMIDIRHPNGFVSRYGHLRGFAAGVRTGYRVTVGKTIGYVGMTGLATAPHLHFEVRVHGEARDPRIALKNTSSDPIPRAEEKAFALARDEAKGLLRAEMSYAIADTSGAKRPTQH